MQNRQPLKTNSTLITDGKMKATEFNRHFARKNTVDANPGIDDGMRRNLRHKEDGTAPNDPSGFKQALTTVELKAALRKL